MADRPAKTVLRIGAELAVIVVGVVIGLAVDRWVAGIDDRAQVEDWTRRLLEDVRQDSINAEDRIRRWDQLAAQGLDVLEIVDQGRPEDMDPTSLVAVVEQVGWWTPFPRARGTWDEMTSVGGLALLRDPELREALTDYYGYQDRLRDIEARQEAHFAEYLIRQQANMPPRLRLAVMDRNYGFDRAREATEDEARALVTALRNDPTFAGALGRAVTTYRYNAPLIEGLLERGNDVRQALAGG